MLSQVNNWPNQLLNFLRSNFGDTTNMTSLSGVTCTGGATRLKFDDGTSVIVKCSAMASERSFYVQHFDLVRLAGVGVPNLHWSGSDDTGRHWIIIEDIPHPFPQERWVCDVEQIEMLVRLHSSTWGDKRPNLDTAAYRPVWNDEMTRHACKWFDNEVERINMMNQLTILQREAQVLFRPTCCVSADPNPTNWRIRANGDLVLIDWERFCYGHPAIDLAITMPGLGNKDGTMEGKIAELYRTCWERNKGSLPAELHDLGRLIRQAKLWSVVEFIANVRLKPEVYPTDTVAYIVRELPGFLDRMVQ